LSDLTSTALHECDQTPYDSGQWHSTALPRSRNRRAGFPEPSTKAPCTKTMFLIPGGAVGFRLELPTRAWEPFK
jgi:hypothetical protein